jgi:hypothetical protein
VHGGGGHVGGPDGSADGLPDGLGFSVRAPLAGTAEGESLPPGSGESVAHGGGVHVGGPDGLADGLSDGLSDGLGLSLGALLAVAGDGESLPAGSLGDGDVVGHGGGQGWRRRCCS